LRQFGQDALLLEGKLLQDRRIGDRDFKLAATNLADASEPGECFSGGSLPGSPEIARGLDSPVPAGRDQLGKNIADFLGPPRVKPALLALAAMDEIGVVVFGWSQQVGC
jgi:hypothetical protein